MFNRTQFGDPLKAIANRQRPTQTRRFDPRNMGFGDPLKQFAQGSGSTSPQQSIIQSLMAGLKGRENAKY